MSRVADPLEPAVIVIQPTTGWASHAQLTERSPDDPGAIVCVDETSSRSSRWTCPAAKPVVVPRQLTESRTRAACSTSTVKARRVPSRVERSRRASPRGLS